MICRVCDGEKFETVLDLGLQPWGNHFLKPSEVGKEPKYPLQLIYCTKCTTAQLTHTVAKEVMFADHTYLSGVTASLNQHFKEVAEKADQAFFSNQKEKSVLDIGSNDGTQLAHYKNLGYKVVGVESSKGTAAIANSKGLETLNAFFNLELAKSLPHKFDVINASGVFFHLEELHSVTKGIKFALKEDGVFVVQFIYMKTMMENLAFDQIYHEHLLYYNLKNIQTLLGRHELELFDAYFSPIHGGSIIAYVGHPGRHLKTDRLKKLEQDEIDQRSNELPTFLDFAKRVAVMRDQNREYLEKQKRLGKKVYGMGAPVKGNTLLNYFGVDKDLIPLLVEKNPLRKGLVAPGSHIPIELESELTSPPDVYYVLAWNFKREILANNQKLIASGTEFYFPVDPEAGKS